MANVRVTVEWDGRALSDLRTDPGVQKYTEDVAANFARTFRSVAPHRTGEGAASIQSRASGTKGTRRVGWDKDHFYMGYQELGTKYVRALRFASKALRQYIHD